MTREQKEKLFSELCEKKGDGLANCSKCSEFVNDLCDRKSTSKFTDEELDLALRDMEKTNPGKHEFDVVSRPAHYTSTSIECIDAMVETQGTKAVVDFCVCNAFKYLWRHNSKNGDEDIKKANWYLNKAVELMER
jgi:hypothetical protein